MKHYACIKNSEVINVVVFDNSNEELLSTFINEFNLDQVILINNEDFFINKIVVGGTYDGVKFWLPQPFSSWIKNEENNEWEAPIPYPEIDEEDPIFYQWNEDILNWEEIQVSE